MKIIKEHEVEGDRFAPPHSRVVKHLAAPWTLGTSKLWTGLSIVDPGYTSNPHSHDDIEEVFYVVSGSGRIKIGEEEADITPGCCIFAPAKTVHQLINTGQEILKVYSTTSPPFTPAGFKDIHTPKK